MNIKVIDAFGTHVGDAEVKWRIPEGQTKRQERDFRYHLLGETYAIFEGETTVLLPTKNPQVPWRLEVTP